MSGGRRAPKSSAGARSRGPYGHLLLAPAEGWWLSATWRSLRAICLESRRPPTPCTEFFFFLPHFFIGAPPYNPLYSPPLPPPPTRVFFYFFILKFFGGHLGFYCCKKLDGGKGREGKGREVKEGTRLGFYVDWILSL